ncbi:MAG: MarC family protein [Candidatus Omnitrophica bacterium]|nr:MarC family protein [Candidatus Omnitrophota bacterium]
MTLGALDLKTLVLTLIPIFVAIEPFSNVTNFIALTQGFTKKQRNRVVKASIVTASLAVIAFVFVGKSIFLALGISVSDFLVAGGILLLVVAILMMLGFERIGHWPKEEVGVVPLGTPLIAGPAVLTTVLILLDAHGILPTVLALLLNMALMWGMLAKADLITQRLGGGGTRALSRIMGLLLAAIAVMMMRRGIVEIVQAAMAH